MSDHCESKRILVDIQDNGIIRRADTGYLIGNLSRDYPFSDLCNGTGEMIGNSEQLKSRSVQRREALQKGEPMPEFDKPEMPERNLGKPTGLFLVDENGFRHEVPHPESWTGKSKYPSVKMVRADLAVEKDNKIDNLKMLLEEANRQIATLKEQDRQNTELISSMTDQLDASLDKEKVRELVESLDKWRHYAWDCIDGCKKQEQHFIDLNCDVESVIISLFPEGLGGEE